MTELPFAFAQTHQLLLQNAPEGGLQLLQTEKTPLEAILEVQRLLAPVDFEVKTVDEATFQQQLQRQYVNTSANAIEQIDGLEEEVSLSEVADALSEAEDLLNSEDDSPMIKMLNAILTEAIRANASDIHIEPFEKQLRIRFRIDGQLKTILTPNPALAGMLVSRVKVMAKLDIAEKRLPQDGRITRKLGGREVDLRVSTIPSSYGERVVMRLLDKSAGRLNLTDLGLPDELLQRVQQILKRPYGIFLVTGPTGSGKTTTLYAALSRLNDTQRNIMTVEDPVEYNIEGINQTQVNTKAEMTFAKGLRAILRQDPDVVMIGEIRDRETAEIAVQASLTGHLVLSTLHTNTAVGVVTRLKDMGIEPFLLASSLLGVMAQRLVRKLCPHCKEAHPADAQECELLGVEAATLYHAKGCDACNHTGYSGRQGIYELVTVDKQMRQLIHAQASEQEIETVARQQGPALQQSGFALVLQGVTSLEEVLRVSQSA